MLRLNLKFYWGAVISALMLVSTAAISAELPDFTDLVKEASPAVVNISTRHKVAVNTSNSLGNLSIPDLQGLPPIFRDFFERGLSQQKRKNKSRAQREVQSLGSGFIISPDGYILTNNHVIADADEIIVRLSDRSELKAKVIGTDTRSDVALLKIDGKNLPTVKIGKSDDLKVGEWVLAIGSPFGFDHSVTAGIVSAKGRSLPNENYVPFIQTDVAINPGNSGGPLFNLEGEVIGINSQIYTRSGGFMGLSFAIPMSVALDVTEQLKKNGKVTHGWLGVVIQEVNKDLAESFGLDKPSGALIAQVLDDGPADKSGIQVGDVILSVNGTPVVMSEDLPHLIGSLKPGAEATLRIARAGDRKELTVKVGTLPKEGDELASLSDAKGKANETRLGIRIEDLTTNQKKELDITSGVIITSVIDGPAAKLGLRPGDVITHLNNKSIDSVSTMGKVTKALPDNRSVSMRVLRKGMASFITFKLPKNKK